MQNQIVIFKYKHLFVLKTHKIKRLSKKRLKNRQNNKNAQIKFWFIIFLGWITIVKYAHNNFGILIVKQYKKKEIILCLKK